MPTAGSAGGPAVVVCSRLPLRHQNSEHGTQQDAGQQESRMRPGWGHDQPTGEVDADDQRGHEQEAPPRDEDRSGRISGLHSGEDTDGRTLMPLGERNKSRRWSVLRTLVLAVP